MRTSVSPTKRGCHLHSICQSNFQCHSSKPSAAVRGFGTTYFAAVNCTMNARRKGHFAPSESPKTKPPCPMMPVSINSPNQMAMPNHHYAIRTSKTTKAIKRSIGAFPPPSAPSLHQWMNEHKQFKEKARHTLFIGTWRKPRPYETSPLLSIPLGYRLR